MKWRADSDSLKPRHYEIEQDPYVSFYLYVFEGDKCIHDDLQDTLEIAMECAWEDYRVPKTAWKKMSVPRSSRRTSDQDLQLTVGLHTNSGFTRIHKKTWRTQKSNSGWT